MAVEDLRDDAVARTLPLSGHAAGGVLAAGRSLVPITEQVLRSRADGEAWSITRSAPWCQLSPVGGELPAQGWKLHVAATAASAPAVLARTLPLLLDARTSFKFAAGVDDVVRLNAPNCPRAAAGKFITAYPVDDALLVALAERLHVATAGEDGPAILSDRPYVSGSLVHLRYGAFRGELVLSNDGEYRAMLRGPDGELVEDRREPRFTPPSWAQAPVALPDDASRRRGGAILLGGRFRVTAAVRHANKGGIYRAIDTADGGEAIVKEARPHVGGDARGHDARDVLRHEAAALERLAAAGDAPRPLGCFEQGGHLFLAQERVAGKTLRAWVADEPDATQRLRVARKLAAAIERAHAAGVVIRDVSPNNVMITPAGELRLIDLELAVLDGEAGEGGEAGEDLGRGRITPGYGAPEQLAGAPAARSADAFSLGAMICHLFTAQDPYFPADDPGGRTYGERLAEWLASGPRAQAITPSLRRLVVALTDEDPARRPTVARARRQLAGARPRTAVAGDPPLTALTDEQWELTVRGTIDHTLAAMDRGRHDRLWPSTAFGATTDPCNVQHGAAGVLGVLCRAHELTGDPRLPDAIATTARWIERRIEREPRRAPGLYFGAAGIAWALCDAGRVLGDAELVQRACALALAQPHDWPSPDVTHGVAGLGMTLLHLWQATGSARLRDQALRCADALAARAEDGPGWRFPRDFDSRFAGLRFHGFAHGTAGIGQLLLDAGLAGGRDDLVALAIAAGDALLADAIAVDDDGLAWASEPDGPQDPMRYWCNGSTGIGGFLLRLHATTADERHRAGAEAAARAVMAHRWRQGLAYCHGLAGGGDFLLDLAIRLGDARYRAWADDVAAIVWSRRIVRDGAVTFGDDPFALVADFHVGLGGILAFFLRLRHGGPRQWLVEGDVR